MHARARFCPTRHWDKSRFNPVWIVMPPMFVIAAVSMAILLTRMLCAPRPEGFRFQSALKDTKGSKPCN